MYSYSNDHLIFKQTLIIKIVNIYIINLIFSILPTNLLFSCPYTIYLVWLHWQIWKLWKCCICSFYSHWILFTTSWHLQLLLTKFIICLVQTYVCKFTIISHSLNYFYFIFSFILDLYFTRSRLYIDFWLIWDTFHKIFLYHSLSYVIKKLKLI